MDINLINLISYKKIKFKLLKIQIYTILKFKIERILFFLTLVNYLQRK
jgi:hypothetical protein